METSNAAGPQQTSTSNEEVDVNVETMMNLTLLDPPRWGWSAAGGVVDVLPPHERARRSSTREAFIKQRRRKEREDARKRKPEQEEAGSKVATGTEQLTQMLVSRRGVPPATLLSTTNAPSDIDRGGPSVPDQVINGPQEAVNLVTANTPSPETEVGDARATCHLVTASRPSQVTEAGVARETVNLVTASGPSPGNEAGVSRATDTERDSTDAQPVDTLPATGTSVLPRNSEPSEPILARINVQRVDQPNMPPGANTTSAKPQGPSEAAQSSDGGKRYPKVIEVQALNDDGVLDRYTYHRGIEGSEPRDEESGRLLCDVEQTDTCHGWEPPEMKLMIDIAFPLSDIDDETVKLDNGVTKAGDGNAVPHYRETMEWDLGDPKTLTPLSFATGISEEFGLDACQTFELATSIQEQINEFVYKKASYKCPLTMVDPNGNERCITSTCPPAMRGPPQLFGSATSTVQAGMPMPQNQAHQQQQQSTREKSPNIISASTGSDKKRSSKTLPSPTEVEPVYKGEVLRRAREASTEQIKRIWMETHRDDPVGLLKDAPNTVCHICHSRRPDVKRFPCGQYTHAMCDRHIDEISGQPLQNSVGDHSDGDHTTWEYCPICCLECDCKKCARRLLSVSCALKSKCDDQGKPPESASFDDILKACVARRTVSAKPKERRQSKENSAGVQARSVEKVPVHEFPREVCGGKDLDPGTSDDYRTVYTAEGAFVQIDRSCLENRDGPASSDEVQEDGNVDYCNICMKHGNLLCCDVCPRAFHPECITLDNPVEGSWECFVCHKEKEASVDDSVNGGSSLEVVATLFEDFKVSDGYVVGVQTLSRIHETVLKLMEYDFGYMFREPVDSENVPGYSELVKKPMDLGTIAARLTNDRGYADLYRPNESWDDVIVAVLRDIELVWHNCFTFNLEGSSVYRMAEVQRRKYQRIEKRSFAHLLSKETKRRVEEFVAKCEQERNKVARIATPLSLDRRVNGRNKITVPFVAGGTSRVIAVLDPETGLVVKMYSTAKAAAMAAMFLAGLGYPSEFPTLNDSIVKNNFRRGSQEPNLLLFGYRWMYMDELAKGKVVFAPSAVEGDDEASAQKEINKTIPPGFVEVKDASDTVRFLSIEEAVSWAGLPEDVSIDEIRDKLCDIPLGEWQPIVGFWWKRLPELGGTEGISHNTSRDEASCLPGNVGTVIVDTPKNQFPSNFMIVREDSISHRVMLGFESADAAYRDWIKALEGSPVLSTDTPTDISYFIRWYLDGDQNVDGMVWKTVIRPSVSSYQRTSPHPRLSLPSQPLESASRSVSAEIVIASEPESGMESDSLDGPAQPAPSNGKETIEMANVPSSPKGATENADTLNPPGKRHAHFAALDKNGVENGDLLGSVKRDRENDLLASRSMKKRIYNL